MRATPTSSANGSTAPPATERSALPVDRNGTHALRAAPNYRSVPAVKYAIRPYRAPGTASAERRAGQLTPAAPERRLGVA